MKSSDSQVVRADSPCISRSRSPAAKTSSESVTVDYQEQRLSVVENTTPESSHG